MTLLDEIQIIMFGLRKLIFGVGANRKEKIISYILKYLFWTNKDK